MVLRWLAVRATRAPFPRGGGAGFRRTDVTGEGVRPWYPGPATEARGWSRSRIRRWSSSSIWSPASTADWLTLALVRSGQQASGDDQALDLVGALSDDHEGGIAVVPLDWQV